jgi:predicted adenine nucleotide alpha hydrolase (AANH) superfamily ATPase
VNDAGLRAAAQLNSAAAAEAAEAEAADSSAAVAEARASPAVQFWEYNWQSDAMTRRKYEVSAEERFYKQEYCGCSYSLRDSNLWRKTQGILPVRIGGDTAGMGMR